MKWINILSAEFNVANKVNWIKGSISLLKGHRFRLEMRKRELYFWLWLRCARVLLFLLASLLLPVPNAGCYWLLFIFASFSPHQTTCRLLFICECVRPKSKDKTENRDAPRRETWDVINYNTKKNKCLILIDPEHTATSRTFANNKRHALYSALDLPCERHSLSCTRQPDTIRRKRTGNRWRRSPLKLMTRSTDGIGHGYKPLQQPK